MKMNKNKNKNMNMNMKIKTKMDKDMDTDSDRTRTVKQLLRRTLTRKFRDTDGQRDIQTKIQNTKRLFSLGTKLGYNSSIICDICLRVI